MIDSAHTPRELAPFFASVLEQDSEAVVICDLDHTIIYMNPAAAAEQAHRGGYELLGIPEVIIAQSAVVAGACGAWWDRVSQWNTCISNQCLIDGIHKESAIEPLLASRLFMNRSVRMSDQENYRKAA